ncbi:MAG: S9 family peptidase [Rhodospirillaceae bacterium TMED8]|nr:S9 family peptidase [Magnetovibrio sp.]OUT49894.1 MAG: S9 family peptidase [Rhodospirillaceae bacterium TMED8]|tara:strand:- start:1336 stop:3435 length:2100 start_codon:yes stop_codon:yes gene_type:complete
MSDQISRPTPPWAEKRPISDTHHGITRSDNYAWIRDSNWQRVIRKPETLTADIIEHLQAENQYTAAILKPLKSQIEALYTEMKTRIKANDSSVPIPDGIWLYSRRFRMGGEYPLFYRCLREGGIDHLILDGDREAEGNFYFKLVACKHSPDHRYFAYAADCNGSEIFTLKIRDMDTGEDLPDIISNVHGEVVWAADSLTILYTVLDKNNRPYAVRLHELGTDETDDVEIYKESDPGFFITISKTESQKFLVIKAHDHQTSEAWILEATNPAGNWRCVEPRDTGIEYDITDWNGAFLIRTNIGGAADFKVVSAPFHSPDRENWRDLVSHEPGRLILNTQVFAKHWVRLEHRDACPRLIIQTLSGEEHSVTFDEEAYALGFDKCYEYDTNMLRFIYSSMKTPEQTFDYNMDSRERVLCKEQTVPSGHDPSKYVVRRIEAVASDGARVPISLLYHKDTVLDGSAPLLLYGYGAYGLSMPAGFSTTRLSLVDRGFIYAIAHIRGGMERGYSWYQGGRGVNKINTFKDFITVAEFLISRKFTGRGRIAAHGGSAGGMLMGAVANMKPDLFNTIIADVPFVDVLTTMLDDTLPLTPPEWPEWGNPIEDPESYIRIAGYSPYDNISAQAYPHIYVTAGLTDPRVTYWEPAKWVAKLRALKIDKNILCLKTHMGAGHGGASGRYKRLYETAEMYSFLCYTFQLFGDA